LQITVYTYQLIAGKIKIDRMEYTKQAKNEIWPLVTHFWALYLIAMHLDVASHLGQAFQLCADIQADLYLKSCY